MEEIEKFGTLAGTALGLGASDAGDIRIAMNDLVRTQPERFFADRFNVTPGLMERLLGGSLVGRVDDADIYLEYRVNEELVLEEGVGQKGLTPREPGRRRPGPGRHADRLRPHRRHLARQPRGGGATGARHRGSRRGPRAAGRGRAAGGRTISTRWPSRRSSTDARAQARPSAPGRRGRARPRIRASSRSSPACRSEEVVVLIATAVGLDGRRRAAAHPAQRHRDRRGRTASARSAAAAAAAACAFDFFLEEERWTRFAARRRARPS